MECQNTFGQRRYSKTRKENDPRCKKACTLQLTSGYTFFWKGKAQNEYRIHGVGLAIKTSLLKNLSDLPVDINERLMKICLPLN